MSETTEIVSVLLEDVREALTSEEHVRAESLVMAALSADPENADALKILAGLKFLAGDDAQALAIYRDAVGGQGGPDAESLHGIASVLLRLDRQSQALPVLYQALSVDADYVPAIYDLGMVYAYLGETQKAIQAFITVTHRDPTHKSALLNCAAAFVRRGNFKLAVSWYGQVLRQDPNDAHTWSSLGLVYRLWGLLDEAANCQAKALEIDPESAAIHWNSANVLLTQGNYIEGFRDYEWRLRRRQDVDPRSIDIPQWQGQPLEGKSVLLTAEQGLGDMIQFSRFAAAITAQGGMPILELHAPLVPLFASQPGMQIHVLGDPLPPADFTAPLMSLPFNLGVSLDDIPSYPPTLKVTVDKPTGLVESGPAIGLVWRGNKSHEFDSLRSLDLETILDLVAASPGTLVSLQTDITDAERKLLDTRGILDAGSGFDSFFDTAQWVSHMTAVVSVDTAMVHLAASLGRPTLMILNRFRDWRWLTKRTDSPWYPSLKIFQAGQKGLSTIKAGLREGIEQAVKVGPIR